ncbi:RagB/SusD family nutrient uptake outer membrane protein [Fodinibius sp.]|uniref:RagB/SusD family nutrient uptake outer membrane protein n=1 Tax=Fodinibius sp. TaxID=1872440 RepID=UPI00356A92A2
MKKFINVTLLSIFLLAGLACDDGVVNLNKEPLGEPSSSTLYTTEEGIHKLLNGAYAQTRSFGLSGFGRFVAKEVGSDDTNPGSTPADGSVPRMEQVNNFTYLTSQGDLSSYYDNNYTLVARANLVINNAPDVEMDSGLQSRYIGEARFLRAFAYFNLVRGWGGVPIYEEVPGDPEEASQVKPRASEGEVYQLIISDLESAVEDLPLKSEYASSDLGRATKGAARTMLAQAYLFQQDYDNALSYATDVIDSGEYNLLDTYDQNWSVEHQNGAESIFEVQFITRDEQDISNEWNKWQGVRGNIGWGFFSPSEDLASAYEDGDPRRDYTIFFEGEAWPGAPEEVPSFAEGADPRANQKTLLPKPWPVGYPSNSPVNMMVMRYADVLLMAAEAHNELGNTGEALMYLEMIRARAREGDPSVLPEVTVASREELRHEIWQERRYELALEGYRYYDIMRYNEVEPGYAKELFDALGKTDFDPNKHTLFPIPQNEIDFSGGQLDQNPGW